MVNLSDCSPDYQHRFRLRQRFWSDLEDRVVTVAAIATLIFLYSPQLAPQRKSLNMVAFHQEAVSATASNVLVTTAKKWVGTEFNPGESAQCAYFVRAVLEESGINVGVTSQPYDGHSTSEGYANSFAGADLGTLIMDESQLKPGDLVMFENTYGNWESGTITHVGIYIGEGRMVDRPTANEPVVERSIADFDFAVGLRLDAPVVKPKPQSKSEADEGLVAIADRLEVEYGIPSAFTIAVGNHESGNGSAVIGVDNWFGVKASANAIAISNQKTTEYYGGSEMAVTDAFCAEGCGDSFARTVVNLLEEQGKTPKGMTPEAIVAALDGKYATDPGWADKVRKHLEE